MAQERLILPKRAQKDRRTILEYWNHRNKSTEYSVRLDALFREAFRYIIQHSYSGQSIGKQNIRFKSVERKYLLIYKALPNGIRILRIWDSRQDPTRMLPVIS